MAFPNIGAYMCNDVEYRHVNLRCGSAARIILAEMSETVDPPAGAARAEDPHEPESRRPEGDPQAECSSRLKSRFNSENGECSR